MGVDLDPGVQPVAPRAARGHPAGVDLAADQRLQRFQHRGAVRGVDDSRRTACPIVSCADQPVSAVQPALIRVVLQKRSMPNAISLSVWCCQGSSSGCSWLSSAPRRPVPVWYHFAQAAAGNNGLEPHGSTQARELRSACTQILTRRSIHCGPAPRVALCGSASERLRPAVNAQAASGAAPRWPARRAAGDARSRRAAPSWSASPTAASRSST